MFWKVLEVRSIFSKLKSDTNLTVVVVSWEILFKKEITPFFRDQFSDFILRPLIAPTNREISFFSMISRLFSANIGLRDLKTPAHEQFLLTLSNCPGFLTFGRMRSINISSTFDCHPKIFHIHLL